MASARINIYENISVGHVSLAQLGGAMGNNLLLNGIFMPGSISFKNVNVLLSYIADAASGTATLRFGLYSINGNSLSLANSASKTFTDAGGAGGISWATLVTSATQDISPGNWYFAWNLNTSSNNKPRIFGVGSNLAWTLPIAGNLVRGIYSATTDALPVAPATSDFLPEGTAGQLSSGVVPYVVISA